MIDPNALSPWLLLVAPLAVVVGYVARRADLDHSRDVQIESTASIASANLGGFIKAAELVAAVAGRLAGAVLLGVDRARLADALARHAPHIPVIDVPRTDDGAMAEVVRAAAALARPGDTVLLAPAAASKDMYISYSHRGDAFAEAVRAHR